MRLVLIDRDGVINRDSASYIKSAEEWVPLPGSLEAIAALTRAGCNVVVITNQSGVARGLFSEQTLAEIHEVMSRAVEAAGGRIAAVFYCPHHPDDGCECRKPKPKLLLDAAEAFGVPIETVPFIGDKASDVEAAEAAGARAIYIGRENGLSEKPGVETFPDLATAVRQLLGEVEQT
jgi:D-glycero-D-manno-heptose 1,7-bisphosphate phosphatase